MSGEHGESEEGERLLSPGAALVSEDRSENTLRDRLVKIAVIASVIAVELFVIVQMLRYLLR